MLNIYFAQKLNTQQGFLVHDSQSLCQYGTYLNRKFQSLTHLHLSCIKPFNFAMHSIISAGNNLEKRVAA